MSQHTRTFVAASIVTAALLAGCSGSDDDPAPSSPAGGSTSADAGTSTPTDEPAETAPGTSAPGPGATEAPGPDSTEAPPPVDTATPPPAEADFGADTFPDTEAASADAQLALVAIRSGVHDGYDRVVLEFSGTGTPGWTAAYAESASQQGSGADISVPGAAVLNIVVNGTTPPTATDPLAVGEMPLAGTTSITGLFHDGTFEGITHVVLGTAEQLPFRVFALADPPRVVIDVQH